MSVEIKICDVNTHEVFIISDLVSKINISTQLYDQPGKLTFTCQADSAFSLDEGTIVTVKNNGVGIFYGYIFIKSRTQVNSIDVTAYDQLRYLQNKDTYILKNRTADFVFQELCGNYGLKFQVINQSYPTFLPSKVYTDKTLYEIMKDGIDKTLIASGNMYAIRDNFGELQFFDVSKNITNICIGDESLCSEYNYESSIDSDTVTQVKLYVEQKQGDQTTGFKSYIVISSANMKKWGFLQHLEKVDEKLTPFEIENKATQILKLSSRPKKTLKVKTLLIDGIFCGCAIFVSIKDLQAENIPNNAPAIINKLDIDLNNQVMEMELMVY